MSVGSLESQRGCAHEAPIPEMVRVGHQKLGAVISNPALRKWGGIILLILFIKSVHCSLEDSPWRVRIENSVAHVYNAQVCSLGHDLCITSVDWSYPLVFISR